jgi:DNA helicase-2/ATP-dependent DNA helicase PcrA
MTGEGHVHDDEALDCEQRAAVTSTEKAIAVLAGPGSGKTRTLSHRARHLLLQDPDAKALLVTFTNKAAAEMKTRALRVGNVAADRITAETFHAFGAQILRNHGDELGIEPDFIIIDDGDRAELAAAVASEARVANYADAWSKRRLRRQDIVPRVAAFGEAFEAAKRAEGIVDFDDLVVYTAQLLETNDARAAAYGARFAHVLVDEFQDTNVVHFAIVNALCPYVETISVFADDDQAIMRFAGADATNIGRFVEDLGATTFPLTCNYRSREAIVERANRLIAADSHASGRVMRADKPGGEVSARQYATAGEEAQAVGDEIARIVLDKEAPAASIAVLVRTAWDAAGAGVVDVLRARRVPVTDWRSARAMPPERRLFATCMGVVRGRLTRGQAKRLCELFDSSDYDERDTHALLERHAGHPVADALLELRAQASEDSTPSRVAPFAQHAIAAHDPALAESAQALVDSVAGFEELDPNFNLDQLLVELAIKAGDAPTKAGGVKIATLHGTKGLEWPTVYMLGLDEGRLPHYRSVDEGNVADERRTCFVGVCRAEDRLVLNWAGFVNGRPRTPSRFLREMGLV